MRAHALIQLFSTLLLVYFISVFPAAQAGTINSEPAVPNDMGRDVSPGMSRGAT